MEGTIPKAPKLLYLGELIVLLLKSEKICIFSKLRRTIENSLTSDAARVKVPSALSVDAGPIKVFLTTEAKRRKV